MLRGRTNRYIHRLRRSRDDGPENKADLTDHGHFLSPKEIGQRTHEGTERSIGDEVCDDEPNPAVNSANVLIDEWENRSEEEEWDLRADP
jgi:hypothetical protein